jgi:ribosomal protein S12 methylthiotransferase
MKGVFTDKTNGCTQMKKKVGILSLGCAKNLVDTEVILGYLKESGFIISGHIEDAEVAIVNTCCFIQEAKEESIDAIVKLCRLKEEGKINKIIVCGCLTQRYRNELINELKEVDAFVGVDSVDKIAIVVKQLFNGQKIVDENTSPEFLYTHNSPRQLLTAKHFAYIKISEGCNNYCSYCIIPNLRGKFRSRTLNSILQEASSLFHKHGVSEINLIGQDTTMYGQDLYQQNKIVELLSKLSRIGRGKWIRLLYTHPAHFFPELIKVIKNESAICKYIDLPIQHINDDILTKMNRKTSRRDILSLIERLRKEVPQLAIRTTLIVGFPGETEEQFKELLEFIGDTKFERLGLFKYSRETSTLAYNFTAQIPERIKQARYEQALALQQDVSVKINEGFLGKEICVLIDERDRHDNNLFLARTQHDAPEVDGCVYVRSNRPLAIGDFVQVKITDTLEYDLVGEVL